MFLFLLLQEVHPPRSIPFLDEESQDKNVQLITDYYAWHEAKLHKNTAGGSPGIGFLPFELSLDMDGLSGIKIYNGLQMDTSFLPSNYPKSLEFVLAGVDHTIQDNDWVTKLRVIACPRTEGVDLTNIYPYRKLCRIFSSIYNTNTRNRNSNSNRNSNRNSSNPHFTLYNL
jgi:hypothetical protein